jgi:hypothetical protein
MGLAGVTHVNVLEATFVVGISYVLFVSANGRRIYDYVRFGGDTRGIFQRGGVVFLVGFLGYLVAMMLALFPEVRYLYADVVSLSFLVSSYIFINLYVQATVPYRYKVYWERLWEELDMTIATEQELRRQLTSSEVESTVRKDLEDELKDNEELKKAIILIQTRGRRALNLRGSTSTRIPHEP